MALALRGRIEGNARLAAAASLELLLPLNLAAQLLTCTISMSTTLLFAIGFTRHSLFFGAVVSAGDMPLITNETINQNTLHWVQF